MGCGCGNKKARQAATAARRTIPNRVHRAVVSNNNTTKPAVDKEAEALVDERRKKEKIRRDTILRALGRP